MLEGANDFLPTNLCICFVSCFTSSFCTLCIIVSAWCLHWRLGHLAMLPSLVLNLAAIGICNDVCLRCVLLALCHLMVFSLACLMRWSSRFLGVAGREWVKCVLCSLRPLEVLMLNAILEGNARSSIFLYETCLAQWQPQSLTFSCPSFQKHPSCSSFQKHSEKKRKQRKGFQ